MHVQQYRLKNQNFYVARISGLKIENLRSTFIEFQKAFQFSDYFGHNGNSFDECINDLEWLGAQGYFLIVTDSHEMLKDAVEDRNWLIKTLNDAGREWSQPVSGEWSRPAIPFHVVLLKCSPDPGPPDLLRKRVCSEQAGSDSTCPSGEPAIPEFSAQGAS